MTVRSTARLLTIAGTLALTAGLLAPAQADTTPTPAPPAPRAVTLAHYSNTPNVPQATSPASLRRYLSTEQPTYDLQSYPIYGSLIDNTGHTNTFSLLTQQTNHVTPDIPGLSFAVEGVMFNTGHGFTVGGVEGIPEYTLPMTFTQRPWSIRAQGLSLAAEPQFVDSRVVKGKVGEKGAVYEYTAHVNAGALNGGPIAPTDIYIRATDQIGMTMWGHGPNGFFPQWIYPNQRDKIMNKYDGSVSDYLKATNDPMTGQGSYYYTAPMLHVNSFTIVRNGHVIKTGHDGTLLMDAVTQSFGPKGNDVIHNNVTWIEFSTQLPSVGKALKIGKVYQKSVGLLPYASMVTEGNPTVQNGTVSSVNWNMDDIAITPVKSSKWTSPTTGKTYYLKYHVTLRGDTPAHFTMSAAFPEQEVAFKGGRAVYEGLYTVTGTLDGQPVTGQAWAEIQPVGTL